MSLSLQFVILSRDRPAYLQEAIDSALKQVETELEYEIIISDNSENNEVMDLIHNRYIDNNKIKYIKRQPTLPDGLFHTELVISELNSNYAVIFHDDDILHPEYLKKISPYIINNTVSAVCVNAIIFKKTIFDGVKKTHRFNSIKRFNNKKSFLKQYFLGNGGTAPFPGYMYKTEYLKKISIKSLNTGKHSDVQFLASLLDYGSILWLPEVLMFYRIHKSGSSSNESVSARLKLLRYMFSEGIDRESQSVFLYRYLFYINWIRQQGSFFINISKWRYRIVAKFLLLKSINVMKTSYFWLTILRKLKILKH